MGERHEGLDLPAMLRSLRRRADLSQRELAGRAGMAPGSVGRLESGRVADPGMRTIARLVAAAGARLTVLDVDGTEPAPLDLDALRDGGDRRYPPHLDPARVTRWVRGAYGREVIGFWRNRSRRDEDRRDLAGERRVDIVTEIRRLGPRDSPALRTLCADAGDFDLAGNPATPAALSDEQALHYLRDPSLRHWIAEWREQVLGHLVAHVLRRHAGRPALVVTRIGIRTAHRAGPVGHHLVAALGDEAARLGAGEIVALADDRAVHAYLRGLGLCRHPRRSLLLHMPS